MNRIGQDAWTGIISQRKMTFLLFPKSQCCGGEELVPISAAPPDTEHTNNVPAGQKQVQFKWVME